MTKSQGCADCLVGIRSSVESLEVGAQEEGVVGLKMAGQPPILDHFWEPESTGDLGKLVTLDRWGEIQNVLRKHIFSRGTGVLVGRGCQVSRVGE